jgi:hypothetical protein
MQETKKRDKDTHMVQTGVRLIKKENCFYDLYLR